MLIVDDEESQASGGILVEHEVVTVEVVLVVVNGKNTCLADVVEQIRRSVQSAVHPAKQLDSLGHQSVLRTRQRGVIQVRRAVKELHNPRGSATGKGPEDVGNADGRAAAFRTSLAANPLPGKPLFIGLRLFLFMALFDPDVRALAARSRLLDQQIQVEHGVTLPVRAMEAAESSMTPNARDGKGGGTAALRGN
ncbi:uncharacterized protein THITE_112876 [Thermothielavioides terrestris NRRL 8126]|uniref:Uncharacterized protein n=1 Tax=Thermothielavioides terrestris (strain ATCC 38088 / NRRL 8126) TaxID=578455 RepID=G2QXE6_THETT|nr:uncharacterized protein THITE_112876 [Thermothielavioides terrestris NRRL 8126]AEO63169.1 hypothetical protein THITE_112876 [Thermothielavioides terrestris NRRL 8126]